MNKIALTLVSLLFSFFVGSFIASLFLSRDRMPLE